MIGPAAERPDGSDDLLRQVHATRGHFALESGYHGDLRLDLDRAIGVPHALERPIDELARRVAAADPEIVCGPLTGGAFVAFRVAALLSRRFCWSTRTAPARNEALHPFAYRVEGDLRGLAGARTVIVDDAINAGSATRATLGDLRRRGAVVTATAALLTVGSGAHDMCRVEGLDLISLAHVESELWRPDDCPLCRAGQPVVDIV